MDIYFERMKLYSYKKKFAQRVGEDVGMLPRWLAKLGIVGIPRNRTDNGTKWWESERGVLRMEIPYSEIAISVESSRTSDSIHRLPVQTPLAV